MTAEDVLAQLPKLDPVELERFRATYERQWTNYSSTDVPGIEKTAGVCGGSARIARTRIPVWLLVEMRRSGTADGQFFECYPSLNAADLEHAWAYAELHSEEIERNILDNSSVEE